MITSGPWAASIDIRFTSDGLNTLAAGNPDGTGVQRPDQVGFATYAFRVGDAPEVLLGTFRYTGGSLAPSGTAANFTYTGTRDDPSFGPSPSVDGIDLSLGYSIFSQSVRAVTLTEALRVTNTNAAPVDLQVFVYSDYDLDGSGPGDVAQRTGPNEFRQTTAMNSFVDTRSTASVGGATRNPDRFEIGLFNETPNLLDRLFDKFQTNGTPTDLSNSPVNLGPADVVHAFQFSFAGLAGGASAVINTERMGTFADVVLPSGPPPAPTPDNLNPPFPFNDPNPPRSKLDPPRFYDPVVAIGYDYVMDAGSTSKFGELFLPGGFEDGLFTLIITDPDHPLFMQEIAVLGDYDSLSFDFTELLAEGVDSFRILGIEPEAGVDPADALGFPTGLTFAGTGAASFTQQAIVPEPASRRSGCSGGGGSRRRITRDARQIESRCSSDRLL